MISGEDTDEVIRVGDVFVTAKVIEAGEIRYRSERGLESTPPRVLLETSKRGAQLLAATIYEEVEIILRPIGKKGAGDE